MEQKYANENAPRIFRMEEANNAAAKQPRSACTTASQAAEPSDSRNHEGSKWKLLSEAKASGSTSSRGKLDPSLPPGIAGGTQRPKMSKAQRKRMKAQRGIMRDGKGALVKTQEIGKIVNKMQGNGKVFTKTKSKTKPLSRVKRARGKQLGAKRQTNQPIKKM